MRKHYEEYSDKYTIGEDIHSFECFIEFLLFNRILYWYDGIESIFYNYNPIVDALWLYETRREGICYYCSSFSFELDMPKPVCKSGQKGFEGTPSNWIKEGCAYYDNRYYGDKPRSIHGLIDEIKGI